MNLPMRGGGVGLHQGVEQGLLAGEIAVEGPCGHTGVLHYLPQGGPLKALVQELRSAASFIFSRVAVDFSSMESSPYNSVI